MIIDEEVYFNDQSMYDFLEHHGVKGQKWGQRHARLISNVKTFGRGTATTGKFIGRETVSTAKFANRHRKGTSVVGAAAAVGVGALFVNRSLKNWGSRTVNSIPSFNKSRPPKWNFRAKGPGFETMANDGRIFDTLIKSLRK